MNADLSKQAKTQLERDAECTTAQVEDSGTQIRGIFSQSSGLHSSKERMTLVAEQLRFTVHLDVAASLEAKKSVLVIEGKCYQITRILRFSLLYLAEILLGPAPKKPDSAA